MKLHGRLLSPLVILSGLLMNGNLPAQQPRVLTLEEAIQIALDKSYTVKSLRLDLEGAQAGLQAAQGRFRTNVGLRLETPNFSEQVSEVPVANSLPVFNTTGVLRYQANLDITQPLPTNGRFTLRSQLYRRRVSTFLAQEKTDIERRDVYTSLSLSFQQPLFTLNTLKAGHKQAKLNYQRAEAEYRRAERDLVYNVTQSFYYLYRAQRQVEIAQEAVAQREQAYELARKKYEAGLIPEVEALQTEVDLAQSRSDLLSEQARLERQRDAFKQLIGLDLSEDVQVQARLDFKAVEVDLEKAIAEGLRNRWEILEGRIQKELAALNVKQVDSRVDVRGDLYAFYDLTGVSDPTLLSADNLELLRSSWEDLKSRPRNRGIVFSLTVPLWDSGVNGAEVAQAEAELQRTEWSLREQEKTVVREIRDAVYRVREAQARFDVLRKSEAVAERSYEISLARFNNGDITSQELALDQNRLTQARQATLGAFIDYELARADLKRKTLWDFEKEQ